MSELRTRIETQIRDRRMEIVRQLRDLQADVALWNQLHPMEPPIVLNLDLTADLVRHALHQEARRN